MVNPSDSEQVEQILETPGLADALESERFKQFLDHMPVAIAVSELRPSEVITYANFEFERLVGRPAGELQGENWQRLPGIAAAMGDDERLSHAVETGEEYIGRFRIALSGGEIEVDAWSNTIQDDDGTDIFRLVALAEVGGARQNDDAEIVQKLRD
jgi:PAS domain S-box-containing protein